MSDPEVLEAGDIPPAYEALHEAGEELSSLLIRRID
jgi:hypothetical protein